MLPLPEPYGRCASLLVLHFAVAEKFFLWMAACHQTRVSTLSTHAHTCTQYYVLKHCIVRAFGKFVVRSAAFTSYLGCFTNFLNWHGLNWSGPYLCMWTVTRSFLCRGSSAWLFLSTYTAHVSVIVRVTHGLLCCRTSLKIRPSHLYNLISTSLCSQWPNCNVKSSRSALMRISKGACDF